MKLIEVIKTVASGEETLNTVAGFGRSLGKTVVTAGWYGHKTGKGFYEYK